ncbi:ricin B-like lectin [Panaeolus papilionaceus]|nr:ricin B-like lectin [Panaeolus papilionaceus]
MTANVDSGATYVITNVKAGTAMDLSAFDNHSVIGWPEHGHPNQQWRMNWTGNSWTFQAGSTGQYLAIEGPPADGTKVIASATPFDWHIWRDDQDPNTFRIFVPNTHQNLDLYGKGNSTPGTPITLWWTWAGRHQTWRFTQV